MNELDKMFEAPSEAALSPLVRFCKARKAAGDRVEVELRVRQHRMIRSASSRISWWKAGRSTSGNTPA